MDGLKIFSGNSNPDLTHKIADYLGVPIGEADVTRFPDGEIFVKIQENIRGRDVFIVQSTCYPPNDNLMEMLIMMDAVKRASAARITAVIPFFGYGRQDRKDQPRVPITAKLVANLITAAGADRVLTMDLHAQQIQGFFDIPVDHLYASPVVVKYLRERFKGQDVVVVAPDAGGLKMAYAYSQMIESGIALVGKQRTGPTEVEATSLVGEVKGRTALLVDDMSTTAGTLCEAARMLEQNGASEIYAAVSHALITPKGIERLTQSPIKELVVTDSVPFENTGEFPVVVLSIAELLGEAILRTHNNASVTSLFRI